MQRTLLGCLKDKLTGADEIRTLRREVEALRQLTIRAYEQTPAHATRLLQLRRTPEWAEAYTERPLVSARLGAYHGGDVLFERAVRSVQNQTYDNWELVIVCDGPDEETAARVSALRDARIRCYQRSQNGPYPADRTARWWVAGTHPFNEATGHGAGSWTAPIDQDDEWAPDHLETLLAAARRSGAEVAYGVCRVNVGASGETYHGQWPPARGHFGFLSAIHHAGLVDFLYDVNAHLAGEPGDWNLTRRMLEAGVRFEFLPQIVATYYVEETAPSADWWREQVIKRGRFAPDGIAPARSRQPGPQRAWSPL